jgi:hypothetical protein
MMLNEAPIAPREIGKLYHVCERPLSVYSAREAVASSDGEKGDGGSSLLQPRVVVGEWALGTDKGRADKAAWTSSVDGSTLEFDLTFGQSPRITMVHTRGYDKTFGGAVVTLDNGSSNKLLLKGCCNSEMKATQGVLTVFNAGQDSMQQEDSGAHGFSAKPFSKAKLHIEFQKGEFEKFSVGFVSSC